ncbi:MAG: efflux RND transporter periplasmic adaptor subunit [candidate division Zixibacteria bacterium]|nr:efflux RND transporter periplasmic adaptor subunit [candidate division Zixibacteria bacterium]
MMIRRFLTRVILLCTIGLVSLSCGGNSSESSGSNPSGTLIPAVEAAQAQYGTLPLTERLSGVVRAKNQVAIYSEVSAPIIRVHVENGDLVGEGDPLISLRATEFEERLKQAKANLQIAVAQTRQAEAELNRIKSELRRAQSLAEKNLSSEAELEMITTQFESADADVALARARVEQAQAQVDERQEELQQTVIRAPVDGTVGNRNAEVGMLVTSNTRLFTLGQLDSIRVEIVLTDRMLNYIETKQRTDIVADALPSGSIRAQLSRISPFLHPVTHSTDAEIDLSNPDNRLKPGMFVTVDVHYGESEQATKIPLSALYENPTTGGTGVYVAADSLDRFISQREGGVESKALTEPVAFDFVPVEVIARGRMDVAVTNVQPDQWVVTIGQDLFAGQKGTARVRPVTWQRVEQLQTLQREDLVQDLMQSRQAATPDSASLDHQQATPQ